MFDNCDDVDGIVKQLLPTINRIKFKSDLISVSTASINTPIELKHIETWIARRVSAVDVLIPELNNLVLQYAGITYITYENIIGFININKLIIPYETKMRMFEKAINGGIIQ